MEPTEHNRRAWDEIHQQRAEAVAGDVELRLGRVDAGDDRPEPG